MLSNNKGISLVVLLVVITLISVLGASLVSVMTSKQKGFFHQIDSYRALNLANAGVEYAIRFASDGTDDSGNSIFYTNQELIMTKYFFQGQGSFEIRYKFDEDVLEAKGSYRNSARRFVRLHHFRRYISPLTLVPDIDTMPKKNGTYVVIPVINNNESPSLTVNAINLAINVDDMYLQQMDDMYLQQIRLDSTIGSEIVFDFNKSSFPTCSMTPTPPCQDASGLLLPRGSLVMFNDLNGLKTHTIDRDSIAYYYLRFFRTAPNGKYIFKPIIVELPAVESTIIFTLP